MFIYRLRFFIFRKNYRIQQHVVTLLGLSDYAETIFASTVDPGQTIDDYFFLKPDTLPVSEVDEIESLTGPMRISTENINNYDISL